MIEPRRPRVLMLIANMGYGGAETAFMRQACYLSRRMEVTIALMARDYDTPDYSDAQTQVDLPVVMLDDGKHAASRGFPGKVQRWGRMLRRLRALKKDYDVTISFLAGPNLLNALAGRRDTTIVSERGSRQFDTSMTPLERFVWTRLLDPLSYRRSRCIVAASEGLAQEVAVANPSIAPRVRAIVGTVLTEHLLDLADAPCEPEFAAFSARPTLVAFGRMHHQKGFDNLIRVFARVRARHPEARLLLIGDGPKSAEYLALARTLGLRAGDAIDPDKLDVVFAGYRPDPLRYLRFARVFVFTSRYEGLGNALVEGVASGVPVLAADCPWGPRSILSGPEDEEILRSGTLPLALANGTLMPLLDTTEGAAVWEAKLAEALIQPPRRRSRDACRAAIERFGIETTGPQWVELIRALAFPNPDGKNRQAPGRSDFG